MRVIRAGFVLAIIGGAVAWFATRPASLDPALLAGLQGDATRGALVFAAAGCAACHTAPDSDPSDRPVLAGGRAFPSDFGRFIAPNISPDPSAGIGAWSDYDLANAIMRGVSPAGAHYYPAFPYTTYAKADPQDIVDLIAHLRTLPASDVENQPHDVGFPFNIRRMLGGWKLLFSTDAWALADPLPDDVARAVIWSRPWGIAANVTRRAMFWAGCGAPNGLPVRPTPVAKAPFPISPPPH